MAWAKMTVNAMARDASPQITCCAAPRGSVCIIQPRSRRNDRPSYDSVMNVLATTSRSVLLIDCATGEARVVHRGAGMYYGIARLDSGYAVAARRRTAGSSIPRADERDVILTFDERLRARESIEPPFALRDVHEIAWFDGHLWVTSTFDDRIALFDGSTWEQWSPELPPHGIPASPHPDAPDDHHHWNSFFASDDELALLAHNHGPSHIHFFDRRKRSFRRTIALGRQAHNIWRAGDAYATCSSIEGRLVATDGWELRTGGFPRGVCNGPSHRAVGLSALVERDRRDWVSGAIALYERSWRLVHCVHLVREGMVLDLAPVDAAAVAAAADLETCSFPLLARLTDADLYGDQGSSGDVSR